jgi:8-oxo-dGTP pyrophosphatase MutT (NUDIX family)
MPAPVRQAAAVPLRDDGLVCMVTSRNRRRWVLPKGRIELDQTAGEAALNESWEEAGLVGVLDGEPVGTYHYEKFGRDHLVTVFVMRVTDEKTSWPERGQRTREWVPVEEALSRIEEPGLRILVRQVFRTGRAVPELAVFG